jgi:hypothetical protein
VWDNPWTFSERVAALTYKVTSICNLFKELKNIYKNLEAINRFETFRGSSPKYIT